MQNENLFSVFCRKTVNLFVIGILVVTLLSFGITNLVYMKSYPETFSWKEWIWLIPAILLVAGVFFLGKELSDRKSRIAVPIIFLIVNIVWISILLSYNTKPVSDWGVIWQAAQEMADGTFTNGLVPGTYMHEIPYQIGLAFLESLFVRVFGPNFTVLKILNLLIMNALLYFLYRYSLRKQGYPCAIFALGSGALFISWDMSVPQFTNHQISALLLVLVFYLYEKNKYISYVMAGIALALLNYLRPVGIIVLLTMICYSIYCLSKSNQKLRIVLGLGLTIVMYYSSLFCVDLSFKSAGYTDEMISQSNRNMLHKISFGLYESEIDGTIADFDYNYEEYDAAFKSELISQIKNNPMTIIRNMCGKICRYLGAFDYQIEMTYDHDESIWLRYPIKAIYSIGWFQYIFYILVAILGFKHAKEKVSLYSIFFIGITLSYLFVEAISNYRLITYFYLLFLTGNGFSQLLKDLEPGFRKAKQNR